jgi:hypothetical protein
MTPSKLSWQVLIIGFLLGVIVTKLARLGWFGP